LYNSNINLWFAKNANNDIVTINEIEVKDNKEKYYCPLCGSEVIPKATKSKLITAHFAHVDASKCNSESYLHFWFKHKFLESGDKFRVVSDKEREYICKEILIEQSYTVGDKIYRPDVTIKTECGNVIYFEMKFSNEKKLKDYIDIWLELKNIVVEVDIKSFLNKDKLPVFNALFYDGKCFNVKKRTDNEKYHDIIGKHKENILSKVDIVDDKLKERLQKLDWFWDDVFRYKKGEKDIEYMVDLIDSIDEDDKDIIDEILRKPKCIDLHKNYIKYKLDKTYNIVINNYNEEDIQYISKHIQYNYIDKCDRGYIKVFDVSDNSYTILDVSDGDINNILNRLNRYLKDNKEYLIIKEKKENWSNITDNILKNINLNIDIINFINELLDKKYRLNIWFNYGNIDKYLLNIAFYFLESGVCAKRYELEIIDSANIDSIVKFIISNINEYFNNLDKINNILEINNIINLLSEHYNFIKDFNIKGNLWLENIYEIKTNFNHYKNIYIVNNGILKDCRSNEILYTPLDTNDLKIYLLNKIDDIIINSFKHKCVDCNKEFSLTMGEIKFFNKKNFNYPRRCKDCRNKRKVNKGGY